MPETQDQWVLDPDPCGVAKLDCRGLAASVLSVDQANISRCSGFHDKPARPFAGEIPDETERVALLANRPIALAGSLAMPDIRRYRFFGQMAQGSASVPTLTLRGAVGGHTPHACRAFV